eukprot:gb/GECG01005544.1/.p1 GENE.gb/GECG01005544.1/~~gb/GECG01005544.1/.p1  ORF type:complete len:1295 (+),score=170.37 gb/GECG01005544.1/:1-3885(+)
MKRSQTMSSSHAAAASGHLNGDGSRRGLSSSLGRHMEAQFSSFRGSPERKHAGPSFNQIPGVYGSRQSPLMKAGTAHTQAQSFQHIPSHSKDLSNSPPTSSWSAQKQEILRARMTSTHSENGSRALSRDSAGTTRSSSRDQEHKPQGTSADFTPKFDEPHSDGEKEESRTKEDDMDTHTEDIWDGVQEKTQLFQALYRDLSTKLDGGYKYTAQISAHSSTDRQREYVNRLHVTSRIAQLLTQSLREKTALQSVVHGGEFLLNLNYSSKEGASSDSYDKLFASTFDTLSSCGASAFHEFTQWTMRPESRNTSSIQVLLSNKGKLTTTLMDIMLKAFAALNTFYCAYKYLPEKEKYRAFALLARSDLDSNFAMVLLSLTLAASTSIEAIIDKAFDQIVEYIDKLQSEKGGINPIALRPESLDRFKHWIVAGSSGWMMSSRNHVDSKTIMEFSNQNLSQLSTSMEEFFQPACLRVLSGAQLLLNAVSSLTERFDKYWHICSTVDAVSQCPSLNKLLRNIMCVCWMGDNTSFHGDCVTGIEIGVGKGRRKASLNTTGGGGLPKSVRIPMDHQSHPFDSAILLSLGIDQSCKDSIAKEIAAALRLRRNEKEPIHYTSFSLLDGSTRLMMNHGLLCDVIRRVSGDSSEKVLTPLTMSVSRANPLQSATEALKREGILAESLQNVFKALQSTQIAELPTQPDPTATLLHEYLPKKGSARILNPQFLSHFTTGGQTTSSSTNRDEGEGHGPRREFYDLLSDDITSDFGPWCIGPGTLSAAEGRNNAVITFSSTLSEEDLQNCGYTKGMRIRLNSSSGEYKIYDVVSYSLGMKKDRATLKLKEPLEEDVGDIRYEVSSKRDALFVRMEHADIFWFNEHLQFSSARILHFASVGWLLGAILFNRCRIPSKFAIALYHCILDDGFEPTLLDASNFDPQLFDQCKTILNASDQEFKSIVELEEDTVKSLAQFASDNSPNTLSRRKAKHNKRSSYWRSVFFCCTSGKEDKSRIRPTTDGETDSSTIHYAKTGYVKKILQQRILGRHETGFWWMLSSLKFGFIKCLGVEVFEFLRKTLKFTPLQLFQAAHAPYYCSSSMTALSLLRFDELLFENSNSTLSILKLFRVAYDAEARRPENKTLRDALWMCVEGMRPAEKRQFIKFVCGSDKIGVPFENQLSVVIPSLSFTKEDHLQCLRQLPTAHTCTNTLELPNYLNSLKYFHPHASEERVFLQLKKTLRDKLMTAIEHGAQQYGLDTLQGMTENTAEAVDSDDDVLSQQHSTSDVKKARPASNPNGATASADIVRVKW